MPTFTLAELVKPVTRTEVQASIYSALGVLGVNTTSWKAGAVPRAVVVAVSVVLAAFSNLMALIAQSGFLELAEGPWLTIVAKYVYGIDRDEATFAPGFVTLSNSLALEYDYDPDDLVFRNPTTGRTYRNVEAVNIPPGPSATVFNVAILATEAGSASTSAPETITELVTTVLGVTVTNPASVIGRDEETDPALRSRCSAKLGSLSPFGPWDAYAYAVRNATRADGTSLGITRIRTVKDGYGNVTTYVASPSGEIEGDPDDPDTDLGIANEAIQRNAAPLAVTATTESAVPLPIVVAYELWMYNTSGRTPTEITDAITARIVAFMAGQPIGGNQISGPGTGKVYVDALRAVIAQTFPDHTFHCVVSSPAADVDVEDTEVPTLSGAPTATAIHQVPPPEGFGA